jgi:PAS domain-containing protein
MFDAFGCGVLVASDSGQVLAWNRAAVELVGAAVVSAARCCDVFAYGRPGTALAHGCITELASARGSRYPEVVVAVPGQPDTGCGAAVAVGRYAITGAAVAPHA